PVLGGRRDHRRPRARLLVCPRILTSRARARSYAASLGETRNTCGSSKALAFELLRAHSQRTGRKLAEVADAVVESHLLLLPPAVSRLPATRGGRRPRNDT